MFIYIPPPKPSYEQGGPPSRLEVQQHYLDHNRQRNVELSQGYRQSSGIPLGGLVLSLRRSMGSMLISVGSWMARETGRSSGGSEVLARR